MRRSRSTPSDSFPDDPTNRNQPEGTMDEGDQTWHEEFTPDLHDHCRKVAWNKIRLYISDPDEAMEIAEKVAMEFAVMKKLPSGAATDAYIRQRAEWRALSRLKSSAYKVRSQSDPFFQEGEDGEEYEAIPISRCPVGAEEGFFRGALIREYVKQAVDGLRGYQRACFVLRLMDGREAEEVAQMLGISVGYVNTATSRARKYVAAFLERQGVRPWKR